MNLSWFIGASKWWSRMFQVEVIILAILLILVIRFIFIPPTHRVFSWFLISWPTMRIMSFGAVPFIYHYLRRISLALLMDLACKTLFHLLFNHNGIVAMQLFYHGFWIVLAQSYRLGLYLPLMLHKYGQIWSSIMIKLMGLEFFFFIVKSPLMFKDLSSGQVKVIGKEQHGLYILVSQSSTHHTPCLSTSSIVSLATKDTSFLWHALGIFPSPNSINLILYLVRIWILFVFLIVLYVHLLNKQHFLFSLVIQELLSLLI